MKINKIYLSGPMTGLPKHNTVTFNKAAKKLRQAGYKVINPAELDKGVKKLTWITCLRRDLIAICKQCNKVALLPGWMWSRGAKLEVIVGWFLRFEIHYVEYWLKKKTEYKAN